MEDRGVHESEIKKELDRRLDIILSDGYADPARADIPGWELAAWFGVAIVIAVVTEMIRTGI